MNDDKLVVDALAAGTVMATLAGWLPTIAAALAILWYIIRIWESDTVQAAVKKLKGKE